VKGKGKQQPAQTLSSVTAAMDVDAPVNEEMVEQGGNLEDDEDVEDDDEEVPEGPVEEDEEEEEEDENDDDGEGELEDKMLVEEAELRNDARGLEEEAFVGPNGTAPES
jgi:DNA polymerase epsilon subunit 3